MSAIEFRSKTRSAKLQGPERHHFTSLNFELFWAMLQIPDYAPWFDKDPVVRLIRHEGPALVRARCETEPTRSTNAHDLKNELLARGITAGQVFFEIDGQRVPVADVMLNTNITLGNNVFKLIAKLDGQCEVHCFVEGEHRAWLADLIEVGLELKILRPDMNWEGIIELLREDDTGPVVTAYSGNSSFLHPDLCREAGTWDAPPGDEEDEAWDQLPEDVQWNLCLAAVRKQNETIELEISPGSLGTLFGDGLTAFDIRAYAKDLTPTG